jgi:hypothetical protein
VRAPSGIRSHEQNFSEEINATGYVTNYTETKPVTCGVIAFKQQNICQMLFESHISVI